MHGAVPFCWSFLNQKPSCVLIYLYYAYAHFLLCRQTNSFTDLIVHLFVVGLSLSISWVTQYRIICLLSPPARMFFSSARCFVLSARLTIQSSVVFIASLQRRQPQLPRTSFFLQENMYWEKHALDIWAPGAVWKLSIFWKWYYIWDSNWLKYFVDIPFRLKANPVAHLARLEIGLALERPGPPFS